MICVLLVGLAATGCFDPLGLVDGDVRIRVENASGVRLDSVRIGFPYEGGTVLYGDLAPGERSGYATVEKAYRYAAVHLELEGEELALIPIDYVGESLLEPGRYTYRLGLVDDGNLTFRLLKD